MKSIRVMLVDDHNLVRAGIRALLAPIPEIEVVGEAANGREALDLIQTQPPDVVLMDIAMPGLNGLDTAARVTKGFPGVRIIILSMYANEEYVLQALRAGATGYLLKDADTAELELAIKAVARGETYLSPAVSKHVIDDYLQRVNGDVNPLDRLTPRQREVLQLIAQGFTTKEVAQALGVSAKTIETHRSRLMDQLDIHDVAGLVRYAISVGLVPPDV